MSRGVNSNDGYLEALVKNMPSETVAGYLAILGMVSAMQGGGPTWLLWIIWVCFLAATPFYLYLMKPGNETEKRPWWQVWIFSPIAFFVWSMSAGGAWASVGVAPLVGGVGVILLSGLIFPLISMAVAKASN
jgi:hypothetical protein